jgi:hypothetical protein
LLRVALVGGCGASGESDEVTGTESEGAGPSTSAGPTGSTEPTSGPGTSTTTTGTSTTGDPSSGSGDPTSSSASFRIAQYNIELLDEVDLADPPSAQLGAAVDVISRFSPDILCVEEIQYDFDAADPGPGSFNDGAQNAARLAMLLDAAGSGAPYTDTLITHGNEGTAWSGYEAGVHDPYFAEIGAGNPGLFGYAVVSRHPIIVDEVRVITDFAWSDLPGNMIASLEAETGIVVPEGFPLFTKALVVAPVQVEDVVIDLVILHAQVPVGHPVAPYRNHDELVAVARLLEGGLPGVAPLSDEGRFVVIGDFNADADHGDGFPDAILGLLEHPLITRFEPTGAGTVGVTPEHNTTASVCPAAGGPDPSTGMQFQLDYILPSVTHGDLIDGGMFFPDPSREPDDWAVACQASNHMLLWADLPL